MIGLRVIESMWWCGFSIPATIPSLSCLFRAFFTLSIAIYTNVFLSTGLPVVHRHATQCDKVVHTMTALLEREIERRRGEIDGESEREREREGERWK